MVKHVENQSSDHCMLVLDTKPTLNKKKRRFFFDKTWTEKPEVEEVVRATWEPDCIGSPMFKVAYKIKKYRLELIKWDRLK